MVTKVCSTCKQSKPIDEFNNGKVFKDGKHPNCKTCHRQHAKDWYYNNRERQLNLRKAYQESRRGTINQQKRDLRQRYKRACLQHYSNGTLACVCCGENTFEFLSLDHINNDGSQHRVSLFGKSQSMCGDAFYRKMYREGYTYKDLQVLCFNCNLGKRINRGVCPHISKEGSTTIPKGSTSQANGDGSTGQTAHN